MQAPFLIRKHACSQKVSEKRLIKINMEGKWLLPLSYLPCATTGNLFETIQGTVGGKDVYPKLKQPLLCGTSWWVRKRWNGNHLNTGGLFVLAPCRSYKCSTQVNTGSLGWIFFNTDCFLTSDSNYGIIYEIYSYQIQR